MHAYDHTSPDKIINTARPADGLYLYKMGIAKERSEKGPLTSMMEEWTKHGKKEISYLKVGYAIMKILVEK